MFYFSDLSEIFHSVYILDGIGIPIFNFMHITKLLSKVFEQMYVFTGKEWKIGVLFPLILYSTCEI